MELVDVYRAPETWRVLYELLAEREDHQNISHRALPSWGAHVAFVESRPYPHWYAIDEGGFVGAVYLTARDEIGLFLLRWARGRGLARKALDMLRARHPRPRYLANINPRNEGSIAFFEGMGFRHIQNTYELT